MGEVTVEIVHDESVDIVPQEEKITEEDALKNFFEGLASGETNSISKIRALAQQFIEQTNC